MSAYMPMSTSVRHNRITTSFSGNIFELLRKKEVYSFQEECALVHWGSKRKFSDIKKLVDINAVDDMDEFTKIIINDLDYVQPDFVLFKNNPYVCNERETRTAGCPDLIIEVWSKDNPKEEREVKLDLYSTSNITEHWYIEQDSNEVVCWLGRDKIENQYLSNILITRGGLNFDLRYLAI